MLTPLRAAMSVTYVDKPHRKPCAKLPDTLSRRRNAAHGQVLMNHAQHNRGIKCLPSADWIFHRIPIPRPDRFLPAPMAKGTKVKMESPLVKEMIEFESGWGPPCSLRWGSLPEARCLLTSPLLLQKTGFVLLSNRLEYRPVATSWSWSVSVGAWALSYPA